MTLWVSPRLHFLLNYELESQDWMTTLQKLLQLNQISVDVEQEEKLSGTFFSIAHSGWIIARIWLIKRLVDGVIFLSSQGDNRTHEIETEAKH